MQRSKSWLTAVALLFALGGGVLGLGGFATPAAAQTYVCPPGYYFLYNYGCYPFGGYTRYYVPPPPPIYPYPVYPYAAPWGLGFQFGGRFHDHDFHGHR